MRFNTVKRVEIIIDAIHAEGVLEQLRGLGAEGYTVVRGALGWGDRGERAGGDISDVFTNWLILTTCQPEQTEAWGAALQPVLKRHGGLMLVSDADSLDH